MSKLFFYTKNQFFNFKSDQTTAGFEFLSMSQLLSSQKINNLDVYQQYYIDISSMVGFVKANDSQLFNFEQLFNSFGENISFICDKAYEKDIKYMSFQMLKLKAMKSQMKFKKYQRQNLLPLKKLLI